MGMLGDEAEGGREQRKTTATHTKKIKKGRCRQSAATGNGIAFLTAVVVRNNKRMNGTLL